MKDNYSRRLKRCKRPVIKLMGNPDWVSIYLASNSTKEILLEVVENGGLANTITTGVGKLVVKCKLKEWHVHTGDLRKIQGRCGLGKERLGL